MEGGSGAKALRSVSTRYRPSDDTIPTAALRGRAGSWVSGWRLDNRMEAMKAPSKVPSRRVARVATTKVGSVAVIERPNAVGAPVLTAANHGSFTRSTSGGTLAAAQDTRPSASSRTRL
jgi:hypothetical protein